MLPGHQAQPGGDLPAVVKVPGVSHGCHQRAGRDRANAGDTRQFAAGLALAMPLDDLRLELAHLTVQLFEVIEQALGEQPERAGQLVAGVFNKPRDSYGADSPSPEPTRLWR